MQNNVLIAVEEGVEPPSWLERVRPFVQDVLERCGSTGKELSFFFCSDSYITNLNRDYRNIDEATDVLSFENGDSYADEAGQTWQVLGDVVISLETLPKNAAYFEVDEDEELKRLIIHGILHLHGYDHGEEHIQNGVEPSCEMLRLQKKLLASLSDVHIMESAG